MDKMDAMLLYYTDTVVATMLLRPQYKYEKKVGSSLQDMGTGDHFPHRTPVAQ